MDCPVRPPVRFSMASESSPQSSPASASVPSTSASAGAAGGADSAAADSQADGQPGPLEGLSPSQRALLRIACWVAWSDGDVAREERQLLEKVVAATLPDTLPLSASREAVAALTAPPLGQVELRLLTRDLDGPEARLQAVKLAVLMMGSNCLPGDTSAINTAEKAAYRSLLEVLALPDAEVAEAEWAARQELERPRSLLERLTDILGGFGAWPALEGSELPLGYWL